LSRSWGGDYAYEGTATQEDGSEATVSVDEIDNIIKVRPRSAFAALQAVPSEVLLVSPLQNLTLDRSFPQLVTDRKGEIPGGVGIRIDQVKFLPVNVLKGETYSITVDGVEDEQEVTMERIHVLRKGTIGAVIAVRGDYIFIGLHDASKPAQQFPDASKALCHVSYWCTGADPEE